MAKQIPYYNEETGENYAVDIDDTQRQSELTATGFTTDYKPDVLNSSSLSTVPAINYQTYQEPSVYNVAGLEVAPPLQMTQPEAEAQDFTSRLRGLQSQLLGESATRTAEEEKQNIPALTQTQQDLTSRLTTLKNEALAIPLLMQQQAQGRGITAEGLRPLETGRLRENAIQALSTSALLQAAQGNLTTALTLVDRAVKQKYDPIREQIAVATENLRLIQESPAYSLADKNRAQRQLEIQQAKADALEQQAALDKQIMSIATEAAKNGVDATTLQRIQEAGSPEEALRIATEAGAYKTSGDAFTLSEGQKRYDAAGNLIADNPKQAEQLTEMEKLNIQDKQLSIQQKLKDLEGAGDLDSKTISQLDKISSSFDSSPIVKNFNDVQNKKLSIDAILSRGTGPSDLAAVYDFMKALDPTSVVREAEYASAAASGNVFLGAMAKFNGMFTEQGQKLPQQVRDEFKAIIGEKFNAVKQQYSNLRNEKARLINQKTGQNDGLDYLIDYDFTTEGKFNSIDDFLLQATDEQINAADQLRQKYPYLVDEDILELINEQNFNKVGGDTNEALPKEVSKVKEGEKGGQCGRFVNKYTGLGLGDTYQSKLAKMDKSITKPEPGMVFVMPYNDTGHTGFIVRIEGNQAIVKDSNYSLDGKIKTHKIPLSKMTGFKRVNKYA